MSTRSSIAIKRKSGKIESIYCHWDGYLSNNGRILLEHYTDIDKINKLIELGDLSSLEEEIDFVGEHSFEKPQSKVCVAYGRDRGETNVGKIEHKDLETYKNYLKDSWCEYAYLYDESCGNWFYSTIYCVILFKELTIKEIKKEGNYE